MSTLKDLLGKPQRSGVVRYGGPADELERQAQSGGLKVYQIDLTKRRGKQGWLDAMAGELKFPGHFGDNWDALDECLRDLHWTDARGWILIVANGATFAAKNRRIWNTALAVLQSAAEHWRAEGKPFWVVFLDNGKTTFADLPELTEH